MPAPPVAAQAMREHPVESQPCGAGGARRRGWVAGTLSFFVCGLGQLRCGRWQRAVLCFAGDLLVQTVCILTFVYVRTYPLNLLVTVGLLVNWRALVVIDAVVIAHRVSGTLRPPWFSRAPVTIALLILCPIFVVPQAAILLRDHVAEAFRFPTRSMSDTLLPGDRFLADKLFLRDPARGDVVVYLTAPDGTWVKFAHRVIGLPGETVEVRGTSAWVDGRELSEPYVKRDEFDSDREHFGPAVVPPGHYFLLGDWRSRSRDSRVPDVGFVARSRIVARAGTVFFSVDEGTGRVRWDRIGRIVR